MASAAGHAQKSASSQRRLASRSPEGEGEGGAASSAERAGVPTGARLGEEERDLRDLHGEGIAIDPEELAGADGHGGAQRAARFGGEATEGLLEQRAIEAHSAR